MAEYIEREALLEHACIGMTRASDTEWQKGYWDGVDDMAEYIREQPAADVVPVVRHGRWLTWEEQFPGEKPRRMNNLGVFCDKCHNHADNRTDFCPNCGAKMDGRID